LVIVDEAHNWKNGPTTGANGFADFVATIARRTRRALLLTATPFQLRPEEMLEILKVGDHLMPCATIADSKQRQAHLTQQREQVIRPVLKNSAAASKRFSRAWSSLPRTVRREQVAETWASSQLVGLREELRRLAQLEGVVDARALERQIQGGTAHVDPALREFLREALRLYVYNADLSSELSSLVIRHRRRTLHRAFLVGDEYAGGAAPAFGRPDRHLLHAAPGIDVRGDAELPHYLLMRCVSEMKGGKGRSSLGSALTGCYSTLLHSSEGKEVHKRLKESPVGSVYLGLLGQLVTPEQDAHHPKLKEVVEAVLRNWRSGEKTLLFCFRVNTAERLREIIDDRIRADLDVRRRSCLGGADSLKTLRSRLTGRDRDLVVLGLDRVLWSYYWGESRLSEIPFGADEITFAEDDFTEIARLALEHRVDLTEERVDRVFLHRAVEHAFARRELRAKRTGRHWKALLECLAEPQWVSHPYGLAADEDADEEGTEQTQFDERGVHSVYEPGERPRKDRVRELTQILVERHRRARAQDQISVFESYFAGPSLWLGLHPSAVTDDPKHATVRTLHQHLRDLTAAQGGFDWDSRRLVVQALRRALLRESVLLRLLPERADLEEQQWGDLLVRQFIAPLPGQTESMADRIAVFLEDLLAASGGLTEEGTAKHTIFQATRLKGQQFARLVSGETDATTRERLFAGFNSPLLPEVLVCTSVGQEGIDLHRHCRHVIHYDLAWNPAVLEQRTGRADRIGSKTFRERRQVGTSEGPFLEIGVPFLAGTYDERMYEELRLRAQTFEVLTGGDLAAENPEGDDAEGEGRAREVKLVPLPEHMVDELRVNLHVWSEDGVREGDRPAASREARVLDEARELSQDEELLIIQLPECFGEHDSAWAVERFLGLVCAYALHDYAKKKPPGKPWPVFVAHDRPHAQNLPVWLGLPRGVPPKLVEDVRRVLVDQGATMSMELGHVHGHGFKPLMVWTGEGLELPPVDESLIRDEDLADVVGIDAISRRPFTFARSSRVAANARLARMLLGDAGADGECDLAADLGLKWLQEGRGNARFRLSRVSLGQIARLGANSMTATGLLRMERRYMVSLDFDAERMRQLLELAPDDIAGKRTQPQADVLVIELDVPIAVGFVARLGDVQHNGREKFVPFVVEQFLPAEEVGAVELSEEGDDG
jgi:hypothetical protein